MLEDSIFKRFGQESLLRDDFMVSMTDGGSRSIKELRLNAVLFQSRRTVRVRLLIISS